jgi:phage tail protein X
MSIKLIAAASVLAVGLALACMFPKARTNSSGGMAPAPGAAESPGASRPSALPTVAEAPLSDPWTQGVASDPAREDRLAVREASSHSMREAFRNPPTMPAEYESPDKRPEAFATAPDDRPRSSAGAVGANRGAARPTTHRIVDGDTLAALALRYLGDAALADRIWEANHPQLPENPNVLPIGLELVIPTPEVAAEGGLVDASRPVRAQTRLVPIEPVPVVADTQPR